MNEKAESTAEVRRKEIVAKRFRQEVSLRLALHSFVEGISRSRDRTVPVEAAVATTATPVAAADAEVVDGRVAHANIRQRMVEETCPTASSASTLPFTARIANCEGS